MTGFVLCLAANTVSEEDQRKRLWYTAQVLLSKETILSAAGSINGFSMYFLNVVSLCYYIDNL